MNDTIIEFAKTQNPVVLAFLGGLFTWFMTALGAAGVFFHKTVNKKILDMMLGFAAGVMIAASYWSLLAPAIEMSEARNVPGYLPAVIGFLSGGIFLFIIDKIIPHLHLGFKFEEAEGIKTSWQRSVLLVLAITIHNIPEGLAVGVAFGAIAYNIEGYSLVSALALTIGIGLQNFPEGLAVSMPLRREGFSKFKSFNFGQISGIVEPISAIIGALFIILAEPILPYALSFAAGAMIFVVVEELIPESQRGENTDLATLGVLVGFSIMMFLDVALG